MTAEMGGNIPMEVAANGDLSKLLGTPFGLQLELHVIDCFLVNMVKCKTQLLEPHEIVTCRTNLHRKPCSDVIPLVPYRSLGWVSETFWEN